MSHELSIYAAPGQKVRLLASFAHSGYESERVAAKQYLRLGKVYTVKQTRVFQSHSLVELEEVPDRSFNTIHFESLTPLSPEQELAQEQQHPDYIRYFGPPPAAT